MTRSLSLLPLVVGVADADAGLQRRNRRRSPEEDAMTRTPRPARRRLHRPHPRAWLADTRDTDYSTARLLIGYNHQS
jgi:hypothetical protein